jgi:hypothetical protein
MGLALCRKVGQRNECSLAMKDTGGNLAGLEHRVELQQGQLLHGVKHVGKVIAVNTDGEALIFRDADIGIVNDCATVVQLLTSRYESSSR